MSQETKNYKNGQCIAITNAGEQCKSGANKQYFPFCGSHRGWITEGGKTIYSGNATPLSKADPKTRAAIMMQLKELKHTNNETEEVKEMPMQDADNQFLSELYKEHDKVVMVTGSRSFRNLDDNMKRWVFLYMRDALTILKQKYDNPILITGMAEGWDAFCAFVCQQVDMPYLAAVPSPSYGEYYWGKKSLSGQNRLDLFNDYLDKAKHVVIVSDDHMYGRANFIRNDWMVDTANHTVFVWDPSSSGTRHAVEAVDKKGLPKLVVSDFIDQYIKSKVEA